MLLQLHVVLLSVASVCYKVFCIVSRYSHSVCALATSKVEFVKYLAN